MARGAQVAKVEQEAQANVTKLMCAVIPPRSQAAAQPPPPPPLSSHRRSSQATELTAGDVRRRATAEGIKAEMRAAAGSEDAPMDDDSDEELAE